MKRIQVLAFVAWAAATFVTTASAGTYKYAVPANINLVMNRDAVATVSAGYRPNEPRYGADDSRNITFTAPATSCWWKIDLKQPYKIDRYRVEFYTGLHIAPTNFAFQTSLDGTAWTTHFSYANSAPTAYLYAGTIPGGAVDAQYFRIECFGYNDATYGMIINRVDLWGPNDPNVSTNISVAQKTWNASDTSDIHNSDGLINEDLIQEGGYLGAAASALPISPEIYLDRQYIIRTLAFCNWGDTRSVKDMDIYGRVGGAWVKIKEIRGLSAATKLPQEFAMDTAVYTDALRYTILSNYGAAEVILMLNLIYAEPPPDAAVIQTE